MTLPVVIICPASTYAKHSKRSPAPADLRTNVAQLRSFAVPQALCGVTRRQVAVRPPSTGMVAPWMKLASSLAR
jgi:hypothetical protein